MIQFLQKGLQRHLDDVSKLYVPWGWWAGRVGGSCGCLSLRCLIWGQNNLVSEMHVLLSAA